MWCANTIEMVHMLHIPGNLSKWPWQWPGYLMPRTVFCHFWSLQQSWAFIDIGAGYLTHNACNISLSLKKNILPISNVGEIVIICCKIYSHMSHTFFYEHSHLFQINIGLPCVPIRFYRIRNELVWDVTCFIRGQKKNCKLEDLSES